MRVCVLFVLCLSVASFSFEICCYLCVLFACVLGVYVFLCVACAVCVGLCCACLCCCLLSFVNKSVCRSCVIVISCSFGVAIAFMMFVFGFVLFIFCLLLFPVVV